MALLNQLRNKFSRSREKPVSVDSFLYSLTQEKELLSKSSSLRKEFTHSDLNEFLDSESVCPRDEFSALFNWHKNYSGENFEVGPVDYVKMVSISRPLAALALDFDKLLSLRSYSYPFTVLPSEEPSLEGKELETETHLAPLEEELSEPLSEEIPESSSEGSDVEESSKEENFEEVEESLVEELTEEETPSLLREDLEDLLLEFSPLLKDYLLAFLDWAHSEKFVREFDYDSLPPSGRALGILKRRFPTSELLWGKAAASQVSKGGVKSNKPSSDEEKKALDEAHEALRTLKRDKRLASIQLNPQNSYLRRLQHNLAVSKGYDSKSSGAEPSRFVVIQKKSS